MASELKIEANRYYRTRDGRKAFVGAVAPDGCTPHFVGWMLSGHAATRAFGWHEDGSGYPTAARDADLIAEWVEPETRKVYLWLVRHGDGQVTWNGSTCKDHHDMNGGACIARKVITITEGEGL